MRGRVLRILLAVPVLLLLTSVPAHTEDKKVRGLHFWGTIVEIDKKHHNFTVEGRWALFGAEKMEDEATQVPDRDVKERELAHFIHIVPSTPVIHTRKMKFCCIDGKTTAWKLNDEPGKCEDLKEGAYVRVWSHGPCPKED
jgi:hypothetical protein